MRCSFSWSDLMAFRVLVIWILSTVLLQYIHTYRVKICWLLTLTLTHVRPRARPRPWVIKFDSPEAEAESKSKKIWLTAQNWVIVLSHLYRPSHRFESNLSTESSNWVKMLDRVIELSQIFCLFYQDWNIFSWPMPFLLAILFFLLILFVVVIVDVV